MTYLNMDQAVRGKSLGNTILLYLSGYIGRNNNPVVHKRPVADPGFPRQGAPTPKVGLLTYSLGNFFPKTA